MFQMTQAKTEPDTGTKEIWLICCDEDKSKSDWMKYIINGKWDEADKGDSIILYRVENECIVLSVDTRKYTYKVMKKKI